MAGGTGLIKRFYDEVLVGGNLSLIDELVMDDVVDHEEGFPGQPPGKEGVRFYVNTIRTAFPDLSVKTVEPALAEGDLEAAGGGNDLAADDQHRPGIRARHPVDPRRPVAARRDRAFRRRRLRRVLTGEGR